MLVNGKLAGRHIDKRWLGEFGLEIGYQNSTILNSRLISLHLDKFMRMNSIAIAHLHITAVMLFLLSYVIKTILLFSKKSALDKYTKVMKVPEMIISIAFLGSGIWLFVIVGGIKTLQIIKLSLVVASIPIGIIGFKKHKKFLALLSLVMVICAYGLAEASKAKPFIPANVEIVNATESPYADGKRIYFEHCVFCHGADGKKMYRGAADLAVSDKNEDAITQFVLQGSRGNKGIMPAYKLIISDENIAVLAKFVKNLRPIEISNDTIAVE